MTPTVTMDLETRQWWTLLRAGSLLNLALLVYTLLDAPTDGRFGAAHLVCASIYAVVCAFRSFFPRVDLERTVLLDHALSSIALGRSAATLAEMAFTVQIAMFVAELGARSGIGWIEPVGWALVPLIALAQLCCWLGVLTLNHLWHAAEESLWGLMMALLAVAFVSAWPEDAGSRVVLGLGLAGCAASAWVMLGLDVPMYLRRWRAERAAGALTLSIAAGLVDAATRRAPTGSWATWRQEVAWMTPYFTLGVWLSLSLAWL